MDSDNAWEEQMYWTHFNFAQFSLVLPPNFLDHLELPRKFVDYMGTRLPEKVVLKVSGVKWYIPLKKYRDRVAFHGEEWQEFAKAYYLKSADILVFKYNRYECFEVLLFDHENSCEKEVSYFVRNSKQPKSDGNHSNGGVEENFSNVLKDRNLKRAYASSEGTRNRLNYSTCRSLQNNSFEGFIDGSQNGKNNAHYNSGNRRRKTARVSLKDYSSEDLTDGSQGEDDSGYGTRAEKGTPRQYATCVPCYQSNRRPVTEAEKEKALEMAKDRSTKYGDSFIIVMRPSCVYRRFVVTIPKEWKPANFFKNGERILLRVMEKTWPCVYSSGINNGGFGKGWKNFTVGNSLEEDDVCVFVPNGRNEGRPILDVFIFRVVADVVPPTLVSP